MLRTRIASQQIPVEVLGSSMNFRRSGRTLFASKALFLPERSSAREFYFTLGELAGHSLNRRSCPLLKCRVQKIQQELKTVDLPNALDMLHVFSKILLGIGNAR
jgi:hypothetical protein